MAIKKILIDSIVYDRKHQARAKMSSATVNDYAEKMSEGENFPPIVVFTDDNENYYPGDGIHRIEASKKIGALDIKADVKQGSESDAMIYALGANDKHGLPRTREDKKNAVRMALTMEGKITIGEKSYKFSQLSDNQIAEIVHIHPTTVGTYRKELIEAGEIEDSDRVSKTGQKIVKGKYGKNAKTKDENDESEEPEEELAEPGIDATGRTVPDDLDELFTVDIPNMKAILKSLKKAKSAMGYLWQYDESERPDLRNLQAQKRHYNRALNDAIKLFENEIIPEYVCPYCKHTDDDCKGCNGTGTVPFEKWIQAPQNLKETDDVVSDDYWQSLETASEETEESKTKPAPKPAKGKVKSKTEVTTNGVLADPEEEVSL